MDEKTIIKCPKCESEKIIKDGNKRGKQAYKCKNCNHRFTFGTYDVEKNKKIVKKDIQFKLKEYEDILQWTGSRTATKTAKKIAKMSREKIEKELLDNLFKGNTDIDYGIIKILIYTNDWGIEKLLDIVFLNDNIHLNRFQIPTIAKHLSLNIKCSWPYIKKWLYEFPEININRVIDCNNFIKTCNRYENYQFIISRFFFKLCVVKRENIIKYIGKQEIENLLFSNYFNKFKKINFDEYGYHGEEMTEIEYSIRTIISKLEQNDERSMQFDNRLNILGFKWENYVFDIIKEHNNGIIKRQKMYENGCRSDFEIITSNSTKIIECKLDAGNKELIETVIKYGRYCDELEIWSLSNQYYYKDEYNNINIKDVYNFLANCPQYKWYNESYINNKLNNENLKLRILYLEDILKKIDNEDLYNKVIELANLYEYIFEGESRHISLKAQRNKKRTLFLSHEKFKYKKNINSKAECKIEETKNKKKMLYLYHKKFYYEKKVNTKRNIDNKLNSKLKIFMKKIINIFIKLFQK